MLPIGLLQPKPAEQPDEFAISRQEVERRAVDAVLDVEEQRGWSAVDMNSIHRNHPGYDVRSTRPGRPGEPGETKFIEVKGRIEGAPTVTVSRNEILTSLNEPEGYILALVEVSPNGTDTVRYLERPFVDKSEHLLFDVTSVNFDWSALWTRDRSPV